MTDSPPSAKAVIEMGYLARSFNEAAGYRLERDSKLQKDLAKKVSNDEAEEAYELGYNQMIDAIRGPIGGESGEQFEKKLAVREIRLAELHAAVLIRALPEKEVTNFMPAAAKTEENAKRFRALGATTLAKLCHKP